MEIWQATDWGSRTGYYLKSSWDRSSKDSWSLWLVCLPQSHWSTGISELC